MLCPSALFVAGTKHGVVLPLSICIRPNSSEAHLHDNTGVGGDTGPKLSSLLTDGAGDGGALHLTLGVDDL